MNDREFRLRLRIDRLTDERDRARANEAKLRALCRQWREQARRFGRQAELWRIRATTKR